MPDHGPTTEQLIASFPVAGPTLRFRSREAMERFFGGLSDGWGENFCDLEWSWNTEGPDRSTTAHLEDAPVIGVEVFDDE